MVLSVSRAWRAALSLSVVALAMMASAPAAATPGDWSTPVTISDSSAGDANNPQIVNSGAVHAVAWERFVGAERRVQVASSVDGGATWTTPLTLSAAGATAIEPQLAARGLQIAAIWRRLDGASFRIQSAVSTDGGTSWSVPATLSAAGSTARSPHIATDGTTLFATWTRTDGTDRLEVATSTDNGATWSVPVTLSPVGFDATTPRVVARAGVATIVWSLTNGTTSKIQASTSTDSGSTWSAPVDVSDVAASTFFPELVTDGSTTTATWERFDGTSSSVQTAFSPDSGATWSSPRTLSAPGGSSEQPQVTTDGTRITVVWFRGDGSGFVVQTVFSADGGVTWNTPRTLSASGPSQPYPQIATSNSLITSTWRLFDGTNHRIQASSSSDGGVTWSTPITLSAGLGDAFLPQIASNDASPVVTWTRSDAGVFRIQTTRLTAAEPELAATGAPDAVRHLAAAIAVLSAVGIGLTAYSRRPARRAAA